MNVVNPQTLYNALVELAIIDSKQLDAVFKESEKQKASFVQSLLAHDLLSDEQLGHVVADCLSFPFVRLSKITIPDSVLQVLPEVVAKAQGMIPFRWDKAGIHLAMMDPGKTEARALLAKKTGEAVVVYYATEQDVASALRLYKRNLKDRFTELMRGQHIGIYKHGSKEIPATKTVDLLIEYAYNNGVSDIHIEPEEHEAVVRFRIDGVLHDVLRYPRSMHDQVITRIKVLAKLRTDEHLSAQDGKIQMSFPEETLDIRVSIVPIVRGENVVLRLLSSRSRQYGLHDLGMSDRDLTRVEKSFKRPHGLVISTGPTGSGKTTTIYSVLKILNIRDRHISTIEDPVEYDIPGISQIQVNPKTNLTFVSGLRSILRQDPDIIFVGEIRDPETASIAINSAMTGHLVLTTLHTNDAPTALPRLIDMGIEPFLVASTINIIIAQRLVRKICDSCKVSYEVDRSSVVLHVSKQLIAKHFGSKDTIRMYRGKGCPVCHGTGYGGRIGIFEVMELTENIHALIQAKANADMIKKQAVIEGMTLMVDDGLKKVQEGITTFEEIMRATQE